MQILLILIAVYIGYQLLFKLIIPVYRASRKIKKSFREMHQHMQDQMKQPAGSNGSNAQRPTAQPDHSDDYIDFEEIK